MRTLTQAEVEALPVGTRVRITWSGGNGPHWYQIGQDRFGNKTIDTNFRTDRGQSCFVSYVDGMGVGAAQPYTVVEVEDHPI